MGMVVRTNTMAMYANRSLGVNNNSVGKALEKLSSGYKINNAADDASGLAVSEKMKSQITGLEQASINCQDGISLVQTAEGATQEIHNMLNRMKELAIKSANGTIQDEVDREAIQAEVNALSDEITRISSSTTFNGISLLDGSLSENSVDHLVDIQIETGTLRNYGNNDGIDALASVWTADFTNFTGEFDGSAGSTNNNASLTIFGFSITQNSDWYVAGDKVASNANALEAWKTGFEADPTNAGYTVLLDGLKLTITENEGNEGSGITFPAEVTASGSYCDPVTPSNSSSTYGITIGQTTVGNPETPPTGLADPIAGYTTIDLGDTKASQLLNTTVTVDNITYELVTSDSSLTNSDNVAVNISANADANDILTALKSAIESKDNSVLITVSGSEMTIVNNTDPNNAKEDDGSLNIDSPDVKFECDPGGLVLQVGDTADGFNELIVFIDPMSTSGLELDDIDLSTAENAKSAVEYIENAINFVSLTRAELGAIQNRLGYTINSLDTTAINMTAAESSIRDTDIAAEMMEYTRNSILSDVATSMLAQANQTPQAVLQLIQ